MFLGKTVNSHSASLHLGVTLRCDASMDYPIQGGVDILLVASCYRNRDKLWPNGPLGSYADFTFTFLETSFNSKNLYATKHKLKFGLVASYTSPVASLFKTRCKVQETI